MTSSIDIRPWWSPPAMVLSTVRFDPTPLNSAGGAAVCLASIEEAQQLVHRVLKETSQLVIRAANQDCELSFAGVGDPDYLLVELFCIRTFPADPIFAGMFSVADASPILGLIFGGYCSEILSERLKLLRQPFLQTEISDSDLDEARPRELGSLVTVS